MFSRIYLKLANYVESAPKQSSLKNDVRNKKYYLIHGTHDDNVHYQQSMLLSAAFEEKYILFRQQAYPDQDHSIGDFHHHLYLSLTSFFKEDCFGALST